MSSGLGLFFFFVHKCVSQEKGYGVSIGNERPVSLPLVTCFPMMAPVTRDICDTDPGDFLPTLV